MSATEGRPAPAGDAGPVAVAAESDHAGAWLFARYAYAPNKLGYCGPAHSETLLGYGATGVVQGDLRALARGFHGAWPYLEILARLVGIDDPLDRQVVEAYWLGGGVADAVDPREFGEALLARIRPQAGHYWKHLTPEILDEAAPNHCFHVFGVYPWSRLLGPRNFEQPLQVLDNCRIRWGRVLERDGDHIVVSCQRLTWEGGRLGLSEPRVERATLFVDGLSFLPDVRPGEWVALHWDWTTDRLTDEQVERLRRTTLRQIEATNRRLARELG
ncbi:Uncharacterized protein LI90_2232 [Carbonactinospora thermoautotrophica]|uniref:Uncharacterized protein n=1 Tax=Carbonactinospora thermoautotrophica TaxID=1469144 RepID=A0A132MTS7_9ACTN|nr:DUF6390 family protein [Carbonactinospora thermoautotrophica]KWX01204.1 Uncharacterized protein LI90_2232 [Carbonactinospora thermoautotrophica]